MKFLKHFESSKQFREVDIQKLWDDFIKYREELFLGKKFTGDQFNDTYDLLSKFFNRNILDSLLINKEVEFHKAKNRIDGEVSFGFDGRIRSINIEKIDNQLNVIVHLEKEDGTIREDGYILAKILLKISAKKYYVGNYPNVVRIYNSWTTEIEDKINMLNNAEKYNL